MPPIEINGSNGTASEKPTVPKIGIIYPPPEVRNIVDKTASFVARNGPDFESRIRQNEINNPKFNFLSHNDPYHAYYLHKVKDISEGKETEPQTIKLVQPQTKLTQEAPKAITEVFVPKDPPKEFEYIFDPPSISAQDIDIVKLTAQFVARNGRQFLTQLMSREQRNFQFDFLRAQHSMFGYFTKLVEHYTKILIPPKDLLGEMRNELNNPGRLLESVKYRMEWQRHEERQRKREQEAAEKDRMAYAQIDWHDFVVVESVDFQRNEVGSFPAPTNPDEVGARVIARERGDEADALLTQKHEDINAAGRRVPQVPGMAPFEVEIDEDDGLSEEEETFNRFANVTTPPGLGGDDMELSDEEEAAIPRAHSPPAYKPPEPAPSPLVPPSGVVVVRDYDPKSHSAGHAGSSLQPVMLISPFTGEKIPANQVPRHVKVGLLDPKWLEQKDREIRQRMDDDQVFASGAHISSNLKHLAEQRSDIFVAKDETAPQMRSAGHTDRLQWDGHNMSKETLQRMAMRSVTDEQRQEYLAQQLAHEQGLNRIGAQLPCNPATGEPIIKKPRDA